MNLQKKMTFQEAEAYLHSFIGMQKPPGVNNESSFLWFEKFLDRLENPHHHFRSVLVAGTKGKGSTAAMLASILRASGWKTGLYTSPHLCSIRERIQINGEQIGEQRFADLVSHLREVYERHGKQGVKRFRTFFELLTALAFLYFAQQQVDIAILEVGIGGRLDATNVVSPLLSIITSISFDHEDILGNSLALIAREKAGIIKNQGMVLSAPQVPVVEEVLQTVATLREARFYRIGKEITWQDEECSLTSTSFTFHGLHSHLAQVKIPLLGRHQITNAVTAVGAAELLHIQGISSTADQIRYGLQTVCWEGRLEILRRAPWVVLDGAHNQDSAEKLAAAIQELFPDVQRRGNYSTPGEQWKDVYSTSSDTRLFLILGISSNKNIAGIVNPLASLADLTIATRADVPRAADPALIAHHAREVSPAVTVIPSAHQAVHWSIAHAKPADVILITGSLYLVGEVKKVWKTSGNSIVTDQPV